MIGDVSHEFGSQTPPPGPYHGGWAPRATDDSSAERTDVDGHPGAGRATADTGASASGAPPSRTPVDDVPEHARGTREPNRRNVLRALAAAVTGGAVLGLGAGCGLRWEADAGNLPLLPRDRWAGADLLLGELEAVLTASQTLAAVGGRGLAPLVAAHQAQETALRQRLAEVHEDTPAPPTGAPTPGTATAAQLVKAEWAGLMDPGGRTLAPAHPAGDQQDVLLVGSVQVARLAFGRRAGGTWPAPSPEDGLRALPAEPAAGLLAHVRATVYQLEIVAARLPQATTKELPRNAAQVAADTLAALNRLETDLTQGAATPTPPPLGYPHGQPTTPEQLRDHAIDALTGLADAMVTALPAAWPFAADANAPAGSPEGPDFGAYSALRTRAADVEHWRLAWGGTMRGTPGMSA